MPDNSETTVELKKLHDLNLQALADDFAELLSKHVGGIFEVALTKLEHTKPDDIRDKLILNFLVADKSHWERYEKFSDTVGFFAEPDANRNGSE